MKSARVLVVDDECPILEIVRRTLEQRGPLATGADSAETAASALFALIDALPEKP